MPDPKFHTRAAALSLKEIAGLSGAKLSDGADPALKIQDVAPLDRAAASDLSFLDNVKYKDDFAKTKAWACFVRPEVAKLAPKGVALLLSDSPYKAYALAAQAFYPAQKPATLIAKTAIIAASATIGKGVRIDDGAVIGENVRIGNDCWIGANAVVSHAIIGDHVRIYPGACIGQDGFGFAPDPKGHVKVPQLGRVIIEDHVEVGANSCVDRGAGPDTVIGQGTWIDNLVQIGHNVKIGKGCILAAQVGIAGSTVIGDFVAMGGQVGISGHLNIGAGARLAAKSGVTRDVPAGAEYMGYPAMPMREYLKGVAYLNRLIKGEKD